MNTNVNLEKLIKEIKLKRCQEDLELFLNNQELPGGYLHLECCTGITELPDNLMVTGYIENCTNPTSSSLRDLGLDTNNN